MGGNLVVKGQDTSEALEKAVRGHGCGTFNRSAFSTHTLVA
jgi:hypothetical protein